MIVAKDIQLKSNLLKDGRPLPFFSHALKVFQMLTLAPPFAFSEIVQLLFKRHAICLVVLFVLSVYLFKLTDVLLTAS